MPTESSIFVEGKITAVLPGTMFRVELSTNHLVLAHLSGKMRKRFIRLTVGDRVKMEISPYDVTKARAGKQHFRRTPQTVSLITPCQRLRDRQVELPAV